MSYPIDTGSILAYLYPALDPQGDYMWFGDRLEWNVDGIPKPTPEEIAAAELSAANAATWAAQAQARKDREAKAALALPDSDDPVILRRKLNAALHIIQR